MADDLGEILATAQRVAPDVPAEIWERLELAIRQEHGATRVYIARRSKGLHLQAIESAGDDADAEKLAKILGISPRRVRQLMELI
jgi:hypothetical protein